MNMPVNLFFVRHAESVGNVAKDAMYKGKGNQLFSAIHTTHTSTWPLSDNGVMQASILGEYLKKLAYEYRMRFDGLLTSPYVRAMSTAGLLGLPEARWMMEPDLVEFDWGELDRLNPAIRERMFREEMSLRETMPFYWQAPRGDKFHDFYSRTEWFIIDKLPLLNAENMLMVTHSKVFKMARMVLMGLTPMDYGDIEVSKDQKDIIENGQIDHYTRRNPETGILDDTFQWMRVYRPCQQPDAPVFIDWQHFSQKSFSNEDLLREAATLSVPVRGHIQALETKERARRNRAKK